MIEFKGSCRPIVSRKTLPVLIQFDGTFMHVWHLGDPFYRLISSDDFTILPSSDRRMRIIRAAHGLCVETKDSHELQQLKMHSDQLRRLNMRKAVKRPLIAIAAALICLWLGLWLVQHAGAI